MDSPLAASEHVAVDDGAVVLDDLLGRVAQGTEIVLTRGGVAVARLTQPAEESALMAADVIEEMRALRARLHDQGFRPLDWQEIFAMRDEGRR